MIEIGAGKTKTLSFLDPHHAPSAQFLAAIGALAIAARHKNNNLVGRLFFHGVRTGQSVPKLFESRKRAAVKR